MHGEARFQARSIMKYCALIALIVLYVICFFHSCIWSFRMHEFQKTNPLAVSEIRMVDEREKARKKAIERIKQELIRDTLKGMIKTQVEIRKMQAKIRNKEEKLASLREELRTLSASKEN